MNWFARGDDGVTGKTGPQGIGIVGRQGPAGEHGDHGQDGHDGKDGLVGERGPRGYSGAITRQQVIAIAIFVLFCFIVLAWRTELATNRLDSQQREIVTNSQRISDAQYASCMGGVEILRRFNSEQDALAKIERNLAADPGVSEAGIEAATARVAAYEAARVLPLPTCVKR